MNTVIKILILVEKPIKNSDKFFSYIQKHFKNNRPEISYKEFK